MTLGSVALLFNSLVRATALRACRTHSLGEMLRGYPGGTRNYNSPASDTALLPDTTLKGTERQYRPAPQRIEMQSMGSGVAAAPEAT